VWPVSERFLEALRSPHTLRTVVTVTPPGGVATPVEVVSGSITVDAASRVRRSGSLTLYGDQAMFELVSTPGAVVQVLHGLAFGSSVELVPVLTGELSSPAQQVGVGRISVRLVDFGQRVSRCRFTTPYLGVEAATRPATIAAVVTDAVPTVAVSNTSTDVGTVGAGRTWKENRWDVVTDLALDGGTEAFFRPDGSFTIRNAPQITDPYVWTVNAGDGGVLISAGRERTLDRLYNTVIVRSSATDGTQAWDPQTVEVTDTSSPLHSSKIGVAPYFFASPTATTSGEAVAVGQRLLERLTGLQETLSVQSISNPALEANDVVRIITPRTGVDVPEILTHFIDSISFDLVSGSMSLGTRALGVDDA
jgi:hypothetical protein